MIFERENLMNLLFFGVALIIVILSIFCVKTPLYSLLFLALILLSALILKFEFMFLFLVLVFELYHFPIYTALDKIGISNFGLIIQCKKALIIIGFFYILRNFHLIRSMFKNIKWFQNPLLIFFLLLVWQVISAFFSTKQYEDELYKIIVTITLLTLYHFVVSSYCLIYLYKNFTKVKIFHRMEITLQVLVLPLLVYGIFEMITGQNIFRAYYIQATLLWGDITESLPSIQSFYSSLGFGDYTGLVRVGSSLVNPNGFGAVLAMLIPIFAYKLFDKNVLIRDKIINLMFVILSSICLVGTQSRGALLAFVFAISAMLFFINFRNKIWNFIFPLTIVSCFALVLSTHNIISERFAELETYYSRLFIARVIFDNIGENPIFGFGYRNLSSFIAQKIRIEYIANAHNFWLDYLSGSGIPALILVVFFQIIVFYTLIKLINYFKNIDRKLHLIGIAIFAMFIAVTVFGVSGTAADHWLPFLILYFLYYSMYLYLTRSKLNLR